MGQTLCQHLKCRVLLVCQKHFGEHVRILHSIKIDLLNPQMVLFIRLSPKRCHSYLIDLIAPLCKYIIHYSTICKREIVKNTVVPELDMDRNISCHFFFHKHPLFQCHCMNDAFVFYLTTNLKTAFQGTTSHKQQSRGSFYSPEKNILS